MLNDQTPDAAPHATTKTRPPPPLIGWRLLALGYDLWPMLALWMVAGLGFTLVFTYMAGHEIHQNIRPFTVWAWMLWLTCWALTGLYATTSWHRGGQTLGMRPWRLRVVSADGSRPSWLALWVRYAVATVSLLLGGFGFWWAWVDRGRMTWHDRASGTRLLRLPRTSG